MLFNTKVYACTITIVLGTPIFGDGAEAMMSYENVRQEETLPSTCSTTCRQLYTKLQEILGEIHTILGSVEKEKMDGMRDPRIVLASHLQSLAGNITVWMSAYAGKKDKNKDACLYLAPASYKEQMMYIYDTCSKLDVASKLSDQLKKDLFSLSQLFDKLYQKEDLERIKALNAAYVACLKGYK